MLGQCRELVHLDLNGNFMNFGPSGAESFVGVLAQVAALAHLDLSGNWIGPRGTKCLAGVLPQSTALAHLSATIRSGQPGQRALQEGWRSAQCSINYISATMTSALSGKGGFELRGMVEPLPFGWRTRRMSRRRRRRSRYWGTRVDEELTLSASSGACTSIKELLRHY